jgi:hypothetical protein
MTWSNVTFVSLNKLGTDYTDKNIPASEPKDITIDKVAFWVNPDVMGFNAL